MTVYWFDDAPRGGCRVPKTWRVMYWSAGQWRTVRKAGQFGVKRNTHNHVKFAPVVTTMVRIEVELQTTFSGGILEARLLPRMVPKFNRGPRIDHAA